MESFHDSLYAEAWQLAQSGRDRDWIIVQAMPWERPDSQPQGSHQAGQGLESKDQQEAGKD